MERDDIYEESWAVREAWPAAQVLRQVVAQALVQEWASEEHFTVDGTLIQSYASQKSLRPIETGNAHVSDGSDDDDPGNPTVNFRGERRTNQTHRSLTDPAARLARKAAGKESKLSHGMHILMENRNGLIMDLSTSEANGHAERQEALAAYDIRRVAPLGRRHKRAVAMRVARSPNARSARRRSNAILGS